MKRTARYLSLALITSTSLFSQENQTTFNFDEMRGALTADATETMAADAKQPEVTNVNARASITRPLSKKVKLQQQRARAKEAKRAKKICKNFEKQKKQARCIDWGFHAPAQGSHYGFHSVHDIAARGESVEIENGAVFSVSSRDAHIAAGWGKGQPLQIKPNKHWFSNHQYRIFNNATNCSVEAKLSFGPYKNSPYTRRVIQMNTATGVVMLDNNTFWAVSDLNALLQWQAGDFVIIGDNDGWFTGGYNSIIINVATDSFVTAKPTY